MQSHSWIKILLMTRSPNRKLREAREAVGDRLRAYAQKFKEGKRDTGGREARYSYLQILILNL